MLDLVDEKFHGVSEGANQFGVDIPHESNLKRLGDGATTCWSLCCWERASGCSARLTRTPTKLELVEHEAYSNGIQKQVYEVVR